MNAEIAIEKPIKRRVPYRAMKWTAIIMAVIIFLLGGLLYYLWQQNLYLYATLQNNYQRSLYSMVGNIENLAYLTETATVSADGRNGSKILARISESASSVGDNLSVLPIEYNTMTGAMKYFNQLGDYADSLISVIGRGETLTKEQYTTLSGFSKQLTKIHDQLLVAAESNLPFSSTSSPKSSADQNYQAVIADVADTEATEQGSESAATATPTDLNAVLTQINDTLAPLAKLTYQGAYSDHMSALEAKGLASLKEVTKGEAQKIATQFASLMDKDGKYTVTSATLLSEKSAIPVYRFLFTAKGSEEAKSGVVTAMAMLTGTQEAASSDSGNIYVDVSKMGGKVIAAFSNREVNAEVLSTDQAVAKAKEFLNSAGFKGMEVVGQQKSEGELALELARNDGKVYYYPDSVLMNISLGNGQVLDFQAQDYWMNTGERNLKDPTVTKEVAQSGLQSGYNASGNTLAIISDGAGGELYCHEFTCSNSAESDDKKQYMVYINTDSGMEEQIMERISDENGFLRK